jgi:hypothetical protein
MKQHFPSYYVEYALRITKQFSLFGVSLEILEIYN